MFHEIHAYMTVVRYNIFICSTDTDVFVMIIHFRNAIRAEKIYYLSGKYGAMITHKRFISVHEITSQLTDNECRVILSVYCLTGCDTVSSPYGHGRTTGRTHLNSNQLLI